MNVGFFQFLNQWWNLPFLVMLGLVAALFVLQLVGLIGHQGDHDADHGGGDGPGDAHAHGDVHHEGDDTLQGILSFFGIGRVPFMVVWGPLLIFAGFAGIFFNRVSFVWLGARYPGWLFPLALLFALVVALFFTRMAVRLASKLVDTGGKGSSRKHELVGTLGVVASAHLDERFGEIRVRDRSKIEMIVHGHVAGGQAPLAHGDSVVLIEYEEGKELFLVESSGIADKA